MKKDKLTDAISSIDQDIVENFVLLDAKLQKKAATRRSRMIKILSSAACLVLVLAIIISFPFDKEKPITPNNNKPSTGGGSMPPPTYSFESEEDLLLFLDLIRKDLSELAEYDILEVYKDNPPPYFDISRVKPGELFEFPIGKNGKWVGSTEIPYAKKKFENIGYFTVKDNTSIEKFSHTFYRDYPSKNYISYTVITIDGVSYCIDLWKVERENQTETEIGALLNYITSGARLYMRSDLCGSKINLYKVYTKNRYFRLRGHTYFEDYSITITIYVDREEDLDNISLDHLTWRDYYED